MARIEAIMGACAVPAELRVPLVLNARKLYASRQQPGIPLIYVRGVPATSVTILHSERREGSDMKARIESFSFVKDGKTVTCTANGAAASGHSQGMPKAGLASFFQQVDGLSETPAQALCKRWAPLCAAMRAEAVATGQAEVAAPEAGSVPAAAPGGLGADQAVAGSEPSAAVPTPVALAPVTTLAPVPTRAAEAVAPAPEKAVAERVTAQDAGASPNKVQKPSPEQAAIATGKQRHEEQVARVEKLRRESLNESRRSQEVRGSRTLQPNSPPAHQPPRPLWDAAS